MSRTNNFVNPSYNEGTPRSAGNIVNTYTIEEKDTLPDLARKLGVSVDDLLRANSENIPDVAHMIQTGTRIMIPNNNGHR